MPHSTINKSITTVASAFLHDYFGGGHFSDGFHNSQQLIYNVAYLAKIMFLFVNQKKAVC